MSGVYNSRFNDGDGLYDDVRTSSMAWEVVLARSMRGILVAVVIVMPGRTKPTLWSEGGSGSYGFSSMLVYIAARMVRFFRIMVVSSMTRPFME